MRLRWRDLPALLRTPLGRIQFKKRFYYQASPLLSWLATAHRRTLLRQTYIVAVVGSLGKTTATRAIHHLLCRPEPTLFGPNSGSSLAMAILRLRPSALHGAVEVGLEKPGQMRPYARMIRPDMTVVTSVASEHNTSFGCLERTRAEKSEMVRRLPKSGIAVLNGDDPNVLWMATQTRARVVTFGLGETNEVRADNIVLDWPNGTKFRLHAFGEMREVRTQLIGRVMVYPILAAVTVALLKGLSLSQIIPAIGNISPTPGRLEPIRLTNGAYLLRDDYKSPLETIHAALETLSEIPAKRRVVVLGDVSEAPGSTGPIYRDIGMRVAKIASKAIFISLTRKGCESYAAGAKRGGLPPSSTIKAPHDIFKVIEILQTELTPGDVVLIKGRSHQQLDRISLALMGKTVRCNAVVCRSRAIRCRDCPMLERGWNGLRFVI
jgi:UDP-N-acetylmuramoyl-tripeptide--D-alanyl-D-alanine ligase